MDPIGLHDGYNYSLWKKSGSAAMAVTGNGCFKCKKNTLIRLALKEFKI